MSLNRELFQRSVFILLTLAISNGNSQLNNCTCVPFYLCVNGTINTNGETIIDIRFKEDQPCSSYLEICCQHKNLIPATPLDNPTTKKCGYRNPDGVGFKITGDSENEAQFGEFPWMIAVYNKSQYDYLYFYKCGGSLIHRQVVLTAAHCVDGTRQQYKIRAGEWDRQTTNELFQHEDVEIASIVKHPHYKRDTLDNDIALLFLQKPINRAGHINRVCLPYQGTVASGSRCFVTGWGKTKFDAKAQYQMILKKIEVPVVPRDQCQNAFRAEVGEDFVLDPTFMCAGGEEGQDSCQGDGGGPLVCPIQGQENRFQQVGIVSWGVGCGNKGVAGAYVDVARYRRWIDQQMLNKGFNPKSYRHY